MQVNNFLDGNAEPQPPEASKQEEQEYLNQLNLINNLPQLLLGEAGSTEENAQAQMNKKIICDFGDFEDVGDVQSPLPDPVHNDKSPRQPKYKKSSVQMQIQL